MEEKQKKAGLVLLNEGLITEELLKKAEKQHKGTERRLTEILVALGIDAAMIRQTLAERLKLPEVILQGRKVDSDVVELIPESWVRKHGIIPLERVENTLTLGRPLRKRVTRGLRGAAHPCVEPCHSRWRCGGCV